MGKLDYPTLAGATIVAVAATLGAAESLTQTGALGFWPTPNPRNNIRSTSETAMSKANLALGAVAVAAHAYVLLLLAVLPLLRPEYSVVHTWISAYAVGRLGWLMTSVFVAMSLGALALLIGLARLGPVTCMRWVGCVLLTVFVAGALLAAVFPTDAPGAAHSARGEIHSINALVNFSSAMLAALFLSASFGRDTRWRSFQPLALVIAATSVAAFVILFAAAARGWYWVGIANRAFAAALMGWLLLASITPARGGAWELSHQSGNTRPDYSPDTAGGSRR